MSHLIRNHKDISNYIEYIDLIKKEGIDESLISSIIDKMISVNELNSHIKYNVLNSDQDSDSLEFTPKTKNITASLQSLERIMKMHSYILKKDYNIKDLDKLRGYIILNLLSHEVEHACQYSMGEKLIESPNSVISNAYKNLFDIIINYNDNFRNLCVVGRYLENRGELLIERNAQIESYDLITILAECEDDKKIMDAYKDIMKEWILLGYKNSPKGSIFETYNKTGLVKEYNKFNHMVIMSDEERIRYGFPISNKTHKKVLERYK